MVYGIYVKPSISGNFNNSIKSEVIYDASTVYPLFNDQFLNQFIMGRLSDDFLTNAPNGLNLIGFILRRKDLEICKKLFNDQVVIEKMPTLDSEYIFEKYCECVWVPCYIEGRTSNIYQCILPLYLIGEIVYTLGTDVVSIDLLTKLLSVNAQLLYFYDHSIAANKFDLYINLAFDILNDISKDDAFISLAATVCKFDNLVFEDGYYDKSENFDRIDMLFYIGDIVYDECADASLHYDPFLKRLLVGNKNRYSIDDSSIGYDSLYFSLLYAIFPSLFRSDLWLVVYANKCKKVKNKSLVDINKTNDLLDVFENFVATGYSWREGIYISYT